MSFISDNSCSFCKQEVETYPHLFFNCEIVRKFWEEVVRHLHLIEIGLGSWDEIFLGLLGKSSRVNLCNSVIFLLKYIIFSARSRGMIPPLQSTLKSIADYREREKKLASGRGNLRIHLQKWEDVNLYLP